MLAPSAALTGQLQQRETIAALAELSREHWSLFVKGSEQLRFRQGDVVIREGDAQRALYQVVEGSARVELAVRGRPQAVVLGRRQMGDLFGERSLLNGGTAAASVVVDSEEAVFLRVTAAFLHELFNAHADLMG